jgi:hypothetical protein
MRTIFLVIVCTCFVFSSCTYESVEPKTDVVVTDSVILYSKTIAPLVTAQCNNTGCHESGSQDGDFTTYDGLKEKAEDGTLHKRVVTVKDMPQIGSGFTLTDEERGYFAAWIKQGFPNN